jgi:hypothetical protein
VFVAGTTEGRGTLAVFRRDTTTGALSFASLFTGPSGFDGRPRPTVEINDGDEFTRDTDVTLALKGDLTGLMSVEVSNDGGFKASKTGRPNRDGTLPWKLESSGPERLPKTVYVRLLGFGPFSGVLTDSIILDERPPQIASLARRGKRLRVRARDNLSGVKSMQISTNRRRPGRWRKFKSNPPAARNALWVRVRDGAGNPSRWRGVKAR